MKLIRAIIAAFEYERHWAEWCRLAPYEQILMEGWYRNLFLSDAERATLPKAGERLQAGEFVFVRDGRAYKADYK